MNAQAQRVSVTEEEPKLCLKTPWEYNTTMRLRSLMHCDPDSWNLLKDFADNKNDKLLQHRGLVEHFTDHQKYLGPDGQVSALVINIINSDLLEITHAELHERCVPEQEASVHRLESHEPEVRDQQPNTLIVAYA